MRKISDIHEVFANHIVVENDRNMKAVAYAVSKKLEEGHICIDLNEYSKEILEADDSKYAERNPFLKEGETIDIKQFLKSSIVSLDSNNIQPFIYENEKLYLQRYHQYESEIINGIIFLGEQKINDTLEKDLQGLHELVTGLFQPKYGYEEDKIDWQLVAAIKAITNKFMIITGGPGTGKTTTVAKILTILYTLQSEFSVALAAPTGKAAARLNESLSIAKETLSGIDQGIKDKFDTIKASTIHRLLGTRLNSSYFKHNKGNPLEFDVIIIDESSMIDAGIMAKLIESVSAHSQLIFLGDKDQLASVEAGSIFGDLCLTQSQQMNFLQKETIDFINGFARNETARITPEFTLNGAQNLLSEKIIELKKNYRFNDDEGIGKFSKSVIQGKLDDLSSYKQITEEGVNIINEFDFDKLSNNKAFIREIDRFADYINKEDTQQALRLINSVRVLCAVNEGKYGVGNFNKLIANYLRGKELITPTANFYQNQPIIVTRNDYSLGLFNGDVGIIRQDNEGVLKAWFESVDENGNPALKEVLPGYIAEFKTVFAMTIHKSQGSEFDNVVVVLPDKEHIPILTRELLYTGVTRAKNYALIIARDYVIQEAVEKKVSRASGIRGRIENLNR